MTGRPVGRRWMDFTYECIIGIPERIWSVGLNVTSLFINFVCFSLPFFAGVCVCHEPCVHLYASVCARKFLFDCMCARDGNLLFVFLYFFFITSLPLSCCRLHLWLAHFVLCRASMVIVVPKSLSITNSRPDNNFTVSILHLFFSLSTEKWISAFFCDHIDRISIKLSYFYLFISRTRRWCVPFSEHRADTHTHIRFEFFFIFGSGVAWRRFSFQKSFFPFRSIPLAALRSYALFHVYAFFAVF